MLMTRRCYQRSPGDRRRHRRSRLAWRWRRSERNFMRAALPPANFKSTENERGRRGVLLWRQEWRDAEREERGRRGVFVRDTARTSPRSHMVVEKVLYGCVCLSVQFRIFTGKRCRPAVCNNRSPSLPSCFTTVSLSLSLCVSASSFPLLSQKICWRLSLWLMAGVDLRWGRALLAFINNSTAQPVVRLQNLFTPRAVCFVLVCADVSVQMINARITVSVCFSVLLLKVETEWHFDTLTEHVVPKYVYVVNSLGQLHSSTLNLIKGDECVLRGMLSPCCRLKLQRIIPSKKLDY